MWLFCKATKAMLLVTPVVDLAVVRCGRMMKTLEVL